MNRRFTCPALAALAVAGLGFGYAVVRPSSAGGAAGPATKPAATFEVYKDKAGEHRWRLRAANHQVIATSGDGYKEKRDCLAGIEAVRRAAAEAKVVDDPAAP